MNTLAIEKREAIAESVAVTEDTLTVHFTDGAAGLVSSSSTRKYQGTQSLAFDWRRRRNPLARPR